MGIGNIFVATTLAPLVVVLASMSLQLFAIGLEQLKKFSSHSYSKSPLYPLIRKVNFIVNTTCFGDMEIDVKSFHNVLLMALLMALIGVAISITNAGERTAAAAKAAGKGKGIKNANGVATPMKAKKK